MITPYNFKKLSLFLIIEFLQMIIGMSIKRIHQIFTSKKKQFFLLFELTITNVENVIISTEEIFMSYIINDAK